MRSRSLDLGPVAITALAVAAGCTSLPPAWSPTDAELVFSSNHEGGSALYLQRGVGGTPRRLGPADLVANFPEWSPDGASIVFQERSSGRFDLWQMAADGSGARPLVTRPGHDYLPSFAPDGTRLAWLGREPVAGGGEEVRFQLLDLRSGAERPLRLPDPGTSAALAWAPDGRAVVTTRRRPGQRGDLVVGVLDGTSWTPITDTPAYEGAPSISPDGRTIAYYEEDDRGARIVTCDRDGGRRRVLVDDGHAWSPRWSPDGRWLLYTAQVGADPADLDLRAVRVDGHESPITVAGGPGRQAEGRWRPAGMR